MMPELFSAAPPAVKHRAIHLDLKGHPPTFERLLNLLDFFSELRFNVIFIEWEDMFPWSVDESFRSKVAYSEAEVSAFCSKAAELGIELIPLVPTLGHMENFLAAPERRGMRENPSEADLLNPLAPGARELVVSLIDDVLRLMPAVRRFHIGGDEAWAFGTHPQTQAFVARHSAAALFLHHMEPLLNHLLAKEIRPLLWHDMLIHAEEEILARFVSKCDLIVWGYAGHPDTIDHHYNSKYIARFKQHGFTLWAASAFKGAERPDGDLPTLAKRRLNAQAWMEVAQRYEMTGVITTGWSRYNYHVMQCEPLEASLDVLLDQALLFYNGSTCHDFTQLLGLLGALGEGERFATTHAAISALSEARVKAWRAIQYLRGNIWLVKNDARRRLTQRHLLYLDHAIKAIEEATALVRDALEGLTPQAVIESYLAERIKPIEEEIAFAHSQVSVDLYP